MPTRNRLARLLALPVALTLLAAGCGDDGDDTGADGTTTTTEAADGATTTTEAAGDAPSGPEVELLDEGAEPRQPMRLALEQGDTSLASLEFQIEQSQEVDGQAVPAGVAPALRADMRLTVEEAGDDRFVVGFAYESFGLVDPAAFPPEQVAEFDAALAGFDQVTGTSVVNGRGETIEGSVDVPDEVNPDLAGQIDQITQGVEQLSAPFPEEAVGVGARWRVSNDITVEGLTTRQESTYTLVEREGDTYVLEVEMTQTADDQVMDLPDAPPGATVELTEFDVSGTGRIESDLANLVPERSTVDTDGTINFDAVEPDEEGEPVEFSIVQRQAITMELTRLE